MERILSSRNVKIVKSRNDILPLVSCVWVTGLAVGILCSALLWTTNSSGLLASATSHPTVVGLVFSLTVPFILALIAIFAGWQALIYPLLFFRSFAAVMWGSAVMTAFGSAGWLARFLFLFSDIFTTPLYFWFCARRLMDKPPQLLQDLIIVSSGLLMIGLIDITLISPFLVSLLEI